MLDSVADIMCKVVHGKYTKHHRCVGGSRGNDKSPDAHIQVGRRHINLQSRHMATIGKLTSAHALKQTNVFQPFDRGRAVFTGLGQCAWAARICSGSKNRCRLCHRESGRSELINLLEIIRACVIAFH